DDEHDAEKGHFKVSMDLTKAGTVTTITFQIEGIVETPCDRCLAPIEMPVKGEYGIIVKFGDPAESTDEVIVIDPEAHSLNVGKHIYDFVLLSIPISRRVPGCEKRSNPPCDMIVLAYLLKKEENNDSPKGDDDSLWGDLRKVIDN
ncbi:MAG: DUF177 domain-containing protein, partial [Saprospiraceae bacterium]